MDLMTESRIEAEENVYQLLHCEYSENTKKKELRIVDVIRKMPGSIMLYI
jgi:hypothetical protein